MFVAALQKTRKMVEGWRGAVVNIGGVDEGDDQKGPADEWIGKKGGVNEEVETKGRQTNSIDGEDGEDDEDGRIETMLNLKREAFPKDANKAESSTIGVTSADVR